MGTFPPLELVSMNRLLGFGPALSSASARAALASRGSHTSWFAWQIELDCTYFGTPNIVGFTHPRSPPVEVEAFRSVDTLG